MLDLEDSGRQIGKKLLSLLSPNQKKELAQFVRDYEAGDIPADLPYTTHFRGQYFTPLQVDQPLTEIREGDLYFCLEQRLVMVQGNVIPLTVKEFEIFSLLILNPKRVFTYEMLLDSGMARGLHLLFTESGQQPCKQPAEKKLRVAPDLPDYVKSVYGIGYKFEAEIER